MNNERFNMFLHNTIAFCIGATLAAILVGFFHKDSKPEHQHEFGSWGTLQQSLHWWENEPYQTRVCTNCGWIEMHIIKPL